MTVVLGLENPSNWVVVDSQSLSGLPLPEYVPPFEFTKHIVAVLITNPEALDTWNFAGWLSQKIDIGIGPTRDVESFNRRIWLRRTQLLVLPEITPTYKIGIRFPKWFDRATCTIWQYQGSAMIQ